MPFRNLFIGREICKNVLGFFIFFKKRKWKIAADGNPGQNWHQFSFGSQKGGVSVGRTAPGSGPGSFCWLGRKIKIILDEPTAALGVRETGHVLELVAKTRKEKGVSMILISHNLQHVFQNSRPDRGNAACEKWLATRDRE